MRKHISVFPLKADSEDDLSPNDYRKIIKYIKQYRSSFNSYDIIKPFISTGIEKEDN